jgi:hypothetical protein
VWRPWRVPARRSLLCETRRELTRFPIGFWLSTLSGGAKGACATGVISVQLQAGRRAATGIVSYTTGAVCECAYIFNLMPPHVPRLARLVVFSLLLLATASANHDDDLRALSLTHQQEVRPPDCHNNFAALC